MEPLIGAAKPATHLCVRNPIRFPKSTVRFENWPGLGFVWSGGAFEALQKWKRNFSVSLVTNNAICKRSCSSYSIKNLPMNRVVIQHCRWMTKRFWIKWKVYNKGIWTLSNCASVERGRCATPYQPFLHWKKVELSQAVVRDGQCQFWSLQRKDQRDVRKWIWAQSGSNRFAKSWQTWYIPHHACQSAGSSVLRMIARLDTKASL